MIAADATTPAENPLANTPMLLRRRNQWVAWRNDRRDDGTVTKVPYNPKTGRKAQSTNPKTWTDFLAAATTDGFDGPGYCFSDEDGLTGIDLDGCRNPETGEISPWAQEIITILDTYSEVSPSGTGVKLFLMGKSPLPKGKKKLLADAPRIGDKTPAIEIYDRGRYFAVTGLILEKSPTEPQPRQAELESIVSRYWTEAEQKPAPRVESPYLAAAKLIDRARKYIGKMPEARSGHGGHDQTYSVACSLCVGFGLQRDDALNLLREYNARCVPPWDDSDLEHKIDDALQADGERGHLLVNGVAGNGRKKKTKGKASTTSNTSATGNEADAIVSAALTPVISNVIEVEDGYEPKAMGAVLDEIGELTDKWPRRVGSTLFVDDPIHGLAHFEKIDNLFGWLASRARVDFHRSAGTVSRGEVFSELQRTAKSYRAIESYPHFPPIEGHYYSHRPIAMGEGEYLRELLNRFCPETQIDRDLILSMFASAVWGGEGGTRPAYVIASKFGRGVGKTALMESVGLLTGGMFAISKDDRAGDIDKRLLTPEAATKRVAGLDNVKTNRLSWADLEARVTAKTISGHQMYSGERTRPNTLLWAITLNGPSLSKDMAQRCVIVHLNRPEHSGEWEESVRAYIERHRWEIFADLAAFFAQPAEPLAKHTRWGTWEREVLARLPEPAEAQKVIAERQGEVDADDEESADIEDFFRLELERLKYKPETQAVHIPNDIARDWYARATGHAVSTTAVTRAIKQAADEGTLKCLRINPTRTHGRGLLWSDGVATSVCYLIHQKIAALNSGYRQDT